MITVLTGSNTYAIAEALRGIVKRFEGEVERYDGGELESRHLSDIFMGASLFSQQRLIILRDVASNKSLWSELEQWIARVPAETEVFLVESSLDKRTRTYKLLHQHGTIQEHKELSDPELAQWLIRYGRTLGVELQPDIAKYLIAYTGKDQWRLSGELEKLCLAEAPITRELVQDVVEPYPEATAFELLDSAFRRDSATVERLVTLLSGREDPYQFFGLLSSQVLGLLALSVTDGKQPAVIARDLGLHPFVISKLTATAKTLGRPRVEKLVEDLAYCDVRIKTSGVNPWQQLRLMLLNIA